MPDANKTVVRLVIRMDAPLHRSLTTEAKRAERSLNGEMLWRLRRSLEAAARSGAGVSRATK